MRGDGGFTLVEVLAALTVFSLAAVGIMQVTAQSVRTADILEERYAARIVASNVLAETLVQANPPTIGVISGAESQLGQEFSWDRQTLDAGENLVQIRVSVTNPETQQVLAELYALRPSR